MNRRNFLSKVVGAAAVVTVAPKVLAEETKEILPTIPIEIDISRIPENVTLQEFVDFYKQNGMLLYKGTKTTMTTEGIIPYMKRITEMRPERTPLDTILEMQKRNMDYIWNLEL